MDQPSPIKDLLYQSLEKFPENTVHERISNGSKLLIDDIFKSSDIDSISGDRVENYETFAESLMHYLLTNAMIPSQRKVTVGEIQVDIVIPDLRALNEKNSDAIILAFPKTNDKASIKKRLEELAALQPNQQNIWLIQKVSLDLPYKTYEIDNGSFYNILEDIKSSKAGKAKSKFKIFKV
jgi:hypothetical protein